MSSLVVVTIWLSQRSREKWAKLDEVEYGRAAAALRHQPSLGPLRGQLAAKPPTGALWGWDVVDVSS